jgi:ketosteroid isomerase-like protein
MNTRFSWVPMASGSRAGPKFGVVYEESFASFPDGRCQLRMCTGNDGRAVAESRFLGTRRRDGHVVEAVGAEMIEIADGKIKEIRDYHKRMSAAVADSAQAGAALR